MLASIIVTNRNGASVIGDCLESLARTMSKSTVELIVVDDNSTDRSTEIIEGALRHIDIQHLTLSLDIHVDAAEARNIGAGKASGKYLAFVDNDTLSIANWLDPCIDELSRDSKIVAVQPCVFPKESYSLPSCGAGGVITPTMRGVIYKEFHERPIFYVLGSALVVRHDIFDQVGRFTHFIGYGHDEVDLCWKIRMLGLEVGVVPQAHILHIGRRSTSLDAGRSWSRNRLLILAKNLELRNALVFLPLAICKTLACEHPVTSVSSLIGFIGLLPHAIKDRMILQELRRVTDKEIFSRFHREIGQEIQDVEEMAGPLVRFIFHIAYTYLSNIFKSYQKK